VPGVTRPGEIRPFNARMQAPLRPTIRGLYVDGPTVIVHFDAEGLARDGLPYRNTYTWYLEMRAGKVVRGTAFYDSVAFNDLWSRVAPPRISTALGTSPR
jgi:ketosteroid isomerase-like protein